MLHSFCAISLIVVLCIAPAFAAGLQGGGSDIKGRITISRVREMQAGHSGDGLFKSYGVGSDRSATLMMHPVHSAPLELNEMACVYLESDFLGREHAAPPAKNPVLDQRGLQFRPHVLPVLVGTTVDFPNRDNLFHNVFSYSKPGEFDLGRYPKDDQRSVTFDTPGTIRVYCDIHSHMNATILVLPHRYFAVPDREGNFVIPHVPAGSYSVVLWYDREVVERRPVDVGAQGTVNVDFTY